MVPFWVSAGLWWSYKGKPWLAKNWMWVVFPVGIVLLLLGWSRKPKQLVTVDTQLHGADLKRDAVSTELEGKVEEAQAERSKDLQDAVKDHQEAVAEVVEDQQAEADSLVQNPDRLNKHLLEVGRSIRGGK